jgi:hypothetical protein
MINWKSGVPDKSGEYLIAGHRYEKLLVRIARFNVKTKVWTFPSAAQKDRFIIDYYGEIPFHPAVCPPNVRDHRAGQTSPGVAK